MHRAARDLGRDETRCRRLHRNVKRVEPNAIDSLNDDMKLSSNMISRFSVPWHSLGEALARRCQA